MTCSFEVLYDLFLFSLWIPHSSSLALEPPLDLPCLCCYSSSLLSLLLFFFLTFFAALLLVAFSIYRVVLSLYTMLLVNGNGKPVFLIQELVYSLSTVSNKAPNFTMGIFLIQLHIEILLTSFSLQIQH